jgi:hypothetical protein
MKITEGIFDLESASWPSCPSWPICLRDTIALDFVFLTNTASAIVSLETQDLDHSAALVAAIGRAGIFVA